MIFAPLEEDETLQTNYIFVIPVMIFSNDITKDEEDKLIDELVHRIQEDVKNDIKFIKHSLELTKFSIDKKSYENSTLTMISKLEKAVPISELKRIINRYFIQDFTVEVSEGKEVRIRPVKEWTECLEYFDIIED